MDKEAAIPNIQFKVLTIEVTGRDGDPLYLQVWDEGAGKYVSCNSEIVSSPEAAFCFETPEHVDTFANMIKGLL